MSKLNLDLPILLIDTSYWLYYRFFSLRNWYYRAYPEKYNNYANDKNSFNVNLTMISQTLALLSRAHLVQYTLPCSFLFS